jgi:iron complex outermembrane recepter protein
MASRFFGKFHQLASILLILRIVINKFLTYACILKQKCSAIMKTKSHQKNIPSVVVPMLGMALFISESGVAQESSPGDFLEPLIVQAEKLERPLEKTLSSISIIDEELLQRGAIVDLNDALRYTANATDADFVDSGIVIRGINSEGVGGPSGALLSTLYVDGLAQTRNGTRRGALGTWDVKQIEVLRGPQSTVSGRNSLAGSLRIETNDPSFDWEGSLKGGFGNNGFYETAGMISGPLNEDWAFRIAGSLQHRDNEITYPNYAGMPRLDERQDDDSYEIRGKLLYQPDGENGPSVLFTASHSYDSPMYRDVDGLSAGVGFFDRVWGLQSLPVFVEARSTEVTQGSVNMSVPLNPDLRIQSITGAVRTLTQRPSVDLAANGEIDELEFSEEFRVIYETDTIEALAGIYLLDRTSEEATTRNLFGNFRESFADEELFNFAIFTDARWQFMENWWLVGGLRYDYEDQEFSSLTRNNGVPGAPGNTSDSFGILLPKAGVIRDFTDGSSLGFTAQKSYRSGGSAIDFINGGSYSYDEETAWNYELSYKGTAFDKRLSYAINAFYLDWKDQQVNVPRIPNDFTSDIILNAGESTVMGGEIEIQARPTDELRVFTSIGIAKTEFDEFSFIQFGAPIDLAGESFPQAPEFTAVLGFDYQFENGFFFGADAKYVDSVLSRSVLEGLPADNMPAYTVINAQFGYRKDNWTITAYVDNLFDKDFLTYRFNDPAFQVATVGAERAYGLSVQYDF